MAGKALAGGTRGIFVEACGDWKWLKEGWHLAQHYGATACCAFCEASKSKGPLNFGDFSDGAAHSRPEHQRTTEAYLASFQVVPSLAQVRGWSLHALQVDFMHTDLGCWIAGNALIELVESGAFGVYKGRWEKRTNIALRQAWLRFK
eukprot:13139839-Alexandrium_andersonii.AAC.1